MTDKVDNYRSRSSSPISTQKRRLMDAQLRDENVQKTMTESEITRKLSVSLVNNTLQTCMDSIILSDKLERKLNVKNWRYLKSIFVLFNRRIETFIFHLVLKIYISNVISYNMISLSKIWELRELIDITWLLLWSSV